MLGGVFITSSDFTPAARRYADAISTRIILINGARLADLMIRYHIGVQVKETYWIPRAPERSVGVSCD